MILKLGIKWFFVVGECSRRIYRVRVQQENEIVGEQEASTVQRGKQKEMNIREKLLFGEKEKRSLVPTQLVGEQRQAPAP